jgi:hypothetical protein
LAFGRLLPVTSTQHPGSLREQIMHTEPERQPAAPAEEAPAAWAQVQKIKGELWPQEQAVALWPQEAGSEPPLSGGWQLLLGPSGTALGSASPIQQKRGVLMPLHHWLRSAS